MLETCLYTNCQRPFSCIIIINELESGMMLLQKFILVCFAFYINSIKPSSYDNIYPSNNWQYGNEIPTDYFSYLAMVTDMLK